MNPDDTKIQNRIFRQAKLFGNKVLFTDQRIDKNSVPEGIYSYDIRHSDSDFSKPVTVESFVLVNWYGTILSKAPMDFSRAISENDPYLKIRARDFRIERRVISLDKWLEHTTIKKRDEPER